MPGPGVPATVAVPSPLSVKVTPVGRAPASLSAGAGYAVVVTVNVPGVPAVNVIASPLVMAVPWLTVSVKSCVAAVPTPLVASIENV